MSNMDPATREHLIELSTPADVEHWGKAAFWSLDEFVTLSFDLEPHKVNWNKIQPLVGRASLADEYQKRRELVVRASERLDLSDRTTPADFLKWAGRHDIACPQNLVEQVEKYSVPAEPGISAEHDEEIEGLQAHIKELEAKTKILSTRERGTLLKIILGMAIGGYVYEPNGKRSIVPKEIAEDLAKVGLEVSEKTIRDKLKEAALDLPRESTDEIG